MGSGEERVVFHFVVCLFVAGDCTSGEVNLLNRASANLWHSSYLCACRRKTSTTAILVYKVCFDSYCGVERITFVTEDVLISSDIYFIVERITFVIEDVLNSSDIYCIVERITSVIEDVLNSSDIYFFCRENYICNRGCVKLFWHLLYSR